MNQRIPGNRFLRALAICSALLLCSALASAKISVNFDWRVFYHPTTGSYIETYSVIHGHSVTFDEKKEGLFGSDVGVFVAISIGDSTVQIDRYTVSSALVPEDSTAAYHFIDVQRYSLNNGIYNMKVLIFDELNPEQDTIEMLESVVVSHQDSAAYFSEAEFVEKSVPSKEISFLSKGDQDVHPYVARFFPGKEDTLKFYAELYGTQHEQDSIFLLRITIEEYETKKAIPRFLIQRRTKREALFPFFGAFDLSSLPTGNFVLKTQLISRKNEVLAEKGTFFQRFNEGSSVEDITGIVDRVRFSLFSKYTIDDLRWHMRSLYPISTSREAIIARNLLKSDTIDSVYLISYMFKFWEERSAAAPEEEWLKYREKVKMVEASYTSKITPGFESDRGRAYLKYGPPNSSVSESSEVGAYPYEIWHYYDLGDQKNIRFIFYNPTLVKNEMELLHCDAFGELQNPQWRQFIYSRSSTNNPFSNTPNNYNINSKLEQNFRGH